VVPDDATRDHVAARAPGLEARPARQAQPSGLAQESSPTASGDAGSGRTADRGAPYAPIPRFSGAAALAALVMAALAESNPCRRP
jgi:hypothetical protein